MTTARSYAWLSIAAALVTLSMTTMAYLLTRSVSLLAAAAELLVNLAAALVAVWALTVAARPADAEHAYGHTKAEYFSSGFEGMLILLAAVGIVVIAIPRLMHPQPLADVGWGLLIAVLAASINGGVAIILRRAGQRLRSITLEADAQHLLTDVWTTGGVLVGVALVAFTHWFIVDSLIALLVAVNILWTGFKLVRASGYGLLDTALPATDLERIAIVLAPFKEQGTQFHALRTRQSGARRFISLHVLVPGQWNVYQGHDRCEAIELALHQEFPETTVFTHLEPQEDPVACEDQGLDRLTTRADNGAVEKR